MPNPIHPYAVTFKSSVHPPFIQLLLKNRPTGPPSDKPPRTVLLSRAKQLSARLDKARRRKPKIMIRGSSVRVRPPLLRSRNDLGYFRHEPVEGVVADLCNSGARSRVVRGTRLTRLSKPNTKQQGHRAVVRAALL